MDDQSYYETGKNNVKVAAYHQAIYWFEKAIERNPRFSKAYFALAYVYYLLGDIDKAVRHYDLCVEIEPDYFQAFVNRGSLLSKEDRQEEAKRDYERAVQILDDMLKADPTNAFIRYKRGCINKKLGNLALAIDDFSEAIKLSPHPEFFHARGRTHLVLSNSDQSSDDLRIAAASGFEKADSFLRSLGIPKYTHAFLDLREFRDDLFYLFVDERFVPYRYNEEISETDNDTEIRIGISFGPNITQYLTVLAPKLRQGDFVYLWHLLESTRDNRVRIIDANMDSFPAKENSWELDKIFKRATELLRSFDDKEYLEMCGGWQNKAELTIRMRGLVNPVFYYGGFGDESRCLPTEKDRFDSFGNLDEE